MSYFGNDLKDEIVEAIKNFIVQQKEKYPSESISQIASDAMSAVTLGIQLGIQEIE